MAQLVGATVNLRNTGNRPGTETVKLYTPELVAIVTRPLREIKAYKRILLEPEEEEMVGFALTQKDLKFFNGSDYVFEPGRFRLWAGADSTSSLSLYMHLG